MTTSPFMHDYSSEDYGDSDDDYCLVPAAATSPQITLPIDDGPPSTDLQYLVIDLHGLELLEVASDLSETVYYDVQPALSRAVIADAAALEEGDAMVESRYYEAVESDADLDPEDAIKEWSDSEADEADAPTHKAELEVEEGDLSEETSETMDAHAALQPEDAIEEPNLEAEKLDAAALETENAVQEFNYEAVESDIDLKPEDPIEEWSNSEAEVANVPTLKAEIAVQGDATEETAKSVPVDADIEAEAAVEVGDATEKSHQALESDFVHEAKEENSVGEREDVFEGDAIGDATQESYEAKESDSDLEAEPEDVVEEDATKESDESLESDAALEGEKYAVEGDATQESYGAEDSDSDFEAEPEDVVEAGYASSQESYESDYDLEWESEGEDGLEKEVNPLPLYMRAELAVTESAQDSVMETFVGRSPMLMLQECRTALISAIDAFLSEVVLLRDRLRRFLGSVFRQREFLNSKYA